MTIRRIVVAAVMALATALLVLSPSANAADQVAVNDKVKDSIVQLATTWTAWVSMPGEYYTDGVPDWNKTVFHTTCTGFVVDQAGFIATAGHCVDNTDEMIKSLIRKQMFADQVKAGKLTEAEAAEWLQVANQEQWLVEGRDRGSVIEREVEVKQPDDPDRVIDDWTTAQVVQFQNHDDGDNALLKVSGFEALKPLVIADDVPAPGAALTVVGFPGNVRDWLDENRMPQPSFKTGTASSQQILPNGAPMTEVSADMAHGMSGGPTVDSNGDVLGVNSWGLDPGVTNFITNAPALRGFLQQNGVDLAERPAPQPSFPWVWVGGAAGVAVMMALLPIALVVSRRRTKRHGIPQQWNLPPQHVTPQPAGYPGFPPADQYVASATPQPPRPDNNPTKRHGIPQQRNLPPQSAQHVTPQPAGYPGFPPANQYAASATPRPPRPDNNPTKRYGIPQQRNLPPQSAQHVTPQPAGYPGFPPANQYAASAASQPARHDHGSQQLTPVSSAVEIT